MLVTDACAFDMTGATVNLILADGSANTLKSNGQSAGLQAPAGATLSITSAAGDKSEDNSLEAWGRRDSSGGPQTGDKGAGIGGPMGTSAGTITINGGTIVAKGGYDADGSGAGIGGGGVLQNSGQNGRSGGEITITGGTVIATAGEFSADIGGGFRGAGGEITINGSANVTATGGDHSPGIDSGYYADAGSASNITINGVSVTGVGASSISTGQRGNGEGTDDGTNRSAKTISLADFTGGGFATGTARSGVNTRVAIGEGDY